MARTRYVARTSVFEVRGSSTAKAANRQGGHLPSGLGAQEGRAADLKGGGLRYEFRKVWTRAFRRRTPGGKNHTFSRVEARSRRAWDSA